jgi:hypothetical protein
VRAEVPLEVVASEVGAFAVDQRLGPHDDSGDAVATLEPAVGGESAGPQVALVVGEALERRDVATLDLRDRERATHLGLAVDKHRAATALALRSTSVLGGQHVEFLAQRREQVRVVLGDRHLGAVQPEGDAHCCPLGSLGGSVSRGGSITPR